MIIIIIYEIWNKIVSNNLCVVCAIRKVYWCCESIASVVMTEFMLQKIVQFYKTMIMFHQCRY